MTATAFLAALRDAQKLAPYAAAVNTQEGIFPENYVKLRFLENHDRPRAGFLIPSLTALESWTAFNYFQRGAALVYAGQERAAKHLPSLFERDTIDLEHGPDLSPLMARLAQIKRERIFAEGKYSVQAHPCGALTASYSLPGRQLFGLFPAYGQSALVESGLPDGQYTDLISGETAEVCFGMVSSAGRPVIIDAALR